MNEASPFSDPSLDPTVKKSLPGSINILTILTFIGCGVFAILSLVGFVRAEQQYEETEKLLSSGDLDKLPGFMKNMVNADSLEVLRRSAENKLPILIITLVSLFLCFYGALQMRKLLKQGFYIWLMGELLPIISSIIFIGVYSFKGFGMLGIIFPVVFIILYATQLKYMK